MKHINIAKDEINVPIALSAFKDKYINIIIIIYFLGAQLVSIMLQASSALQKNEEKKTQHKNIAIQNMKLRQYINV